MANDPQSFGDTFGSMFDAAQAEALPDGGFTSAPGMAQAVLANQSRDIAPADGMATSLVQPEPVADPSQYVTLEPEQVAAADAALAQQGFAPPGSPTSGLINDMATVNADVMAGIQGHLNANPVQHYRQANPLRPIAENQAADFAGRGGVIDVPEFVPEPFEIPSRAADETGEDYSVRVQNAKMMHDTQQAMAKLDHDAANEQAQQDALMQVGDVRTLGEQGRMGLGEASVTAVEQVGEAQVTQDEAMAGAAGEARQMALDAEDSYSRVSAQVQQEREEKLEAVRNVQQVEAGIREELESLPEHDTSKYFNSKTGGQKLWAVIGAMAGGWGGSTAVIDMIEREAHANLASKQGNLQKRLSAAQDATAEQMSVYDRAYDALGNEDAAAAMQLKFDYEDAERFIKQRLAETTVDVARAQLQEALVQVEQKRRDQETAIATMLATTPKSFLRTHDPLGRRNRRAMEGELKDRGEYARHLGDKMIDTSQKGEKMANDSFEKAQDREHKRAEKKNEIRHEGVAQFAKTTAKMRAANDLLEGFVREASTGNVAGRGVGSYSATEEGRKVRETIKESLRRQLRFESQGVIGEDEIEDRVDSMMSGWGDNEMIGNAQRLIDANKTEMVALERGLTESERQHYYRNPNLQPLPAIDGALPGQGADDDATALGGRVVQ